jgi:hypothetical protein
MYTSNELLFPNYAISVIRDMRGPEWRDLVDSVVDLPDDAPEKLAFVLMMVEFDGCMECETDSYRAMRGCVLCAAQTLRRFRGSDHELLEMYAQALDQIEEYLEREKIRRIA